MNDMLNTSLMLVLSLAAGLGLGAIFFGGLWWTVRKCVTARQPALWIAGSLLLRMGVALAGFYFMALGDWRRLLAGLAGFVLARFIVMRATRAAAQQAPSSQEAGHAS